MCLASYERGRRGDLAPVLRGFQCLVEIGWTVPREPCPLHRADVHKEITDAGVGSMGRELEGLGSWSRARSLLGEYG